MLISISKNWRVAFLVLTFVLSAGCAGTASQSAPPQLHTKVHMELHIDNPGLSDWQNRERLDSIAIPADATVIIYLHGTKNPVNKENCDIRNNQVPKSIHALESTANTFVYFLCSRAVDQNVEGSYVDKRGVEVLTVLDRLLSAGMSPDQIFLAGHSAGGWVALMLQAAHGHKFNAAIAFAPACCGRRDLEADYPRWRRTIRPRQVERMLRADHINALVFAYEDDDFNRPTDIGFLAERYPETVRIVGYNCEGGHNTHIDDCRVEETSGLIRDYITARQAD